ncbi:MAG: hypothetical protein RI884_2387 [Pseudomonadota bacterium]
MRRFLLTTCLALVMALLVAAGGALWWLHRPMPLAAPLVDLSIEPGTLPRDVAQAVRTAGVEVSPAWLHTWFRVSGRARLIKAGSYELETGITPWRLLDKLARGDQAQGAVSLIEGWTFRQFRAALAKETDLRQESATLTDEALMQVLGRPGQHPEGRFFPDTYTYSKGSSDLAVLRRALRSMDQRLAGVWNQRTAQAMVRTPDEALVLASIIEKETGRGSDRPLISAVFNNRLRIGMPLQTDPTVIYGMGTAFNGNLRRVDLQTDTPWNTYTRRGMPPTPIAMPGKASLLAAVQPASSPALYFVARGDGSSQFSQTLEEHNRAVNTYQRRP